MNRSASLPDFLSDIEVPDENEDRVRWRRSAAKRWVGYLTDCEREWMRKMGKHSCLDFLDHERKGLRDIFDQLDDGTSRLSTEELIDHLVSMGIIENEDGLKRALANIGESAELQKSGLTFKQFCQMILKSGVELPKGFQAVMHGKLDVDYANHKELRSVITEYRRIKILGAMTGDHRHYISGRKIMRNYSGLINRRGQLARSGGKEEELSAVQLSSLWRNMCREAELVTAGEGQQKYDEIPESPRSVIQKVASNYPSRQNALPVIGTTPDSVIFGGMLQEYKNPSEDDPNLFYKPTPPPPYAAMPEGWYAHKKKSIEE
jgi:hypothetical protein